MGHRSSLAVRLGFAVLAAIAALTALAPAAGARSIYVSNFGFFGERAVIPGSLSIIDSEANAAAPPVEFGTHPFAPAFTPDGRTAYLLNAEPGSVSAVDVATERALGPPIPVGRAPEGLAISPDGSRLYVTDFSEDSVWVIDTGTNQVVGEPIKVGGGPENIAFTPDGTRAYVSNAEARSVSVIDVARGVATTTIPVGRRPEGIAATPDGRSVFVANDFDNTVSVIDTGTNRVVGDPIEVGELPEWVAASPDGRAVYVSNFSGESASVIDTRTDQVLTTVMTGEEPAAIAVSPDSAAWYLVTVGDQRVTGFDARTERPLGEPIAVGTQPGRLAFQPDQPPSASLALPAVARPGVPVRLDASSSRDPDGSIADFAWDFGDGTATRGGGPAPSHSFPAPGTYDVSLTLTDDEGCSTTLVFTGQNASCNGSALARRAGTLTVAFPAVALRCPARARRLGCLFKLQALTKRRRGRAESAITRVRVHAGRSAIASIRPRPSFAGRFMPGATLLFRKTSRVGTARRTTFARLKIVR